MFSIKITNQSDSYININGGEQDVDVRPGDSAQVLFDNDEIVMVTRHPSEFDQPKDLGEGSGEGDDQGGAGGDGGEPLKSQQPDGATNTNPTTPAPAPAPST